MRAPKGLDILQTALDVILLPRFMYNVAGSDRRLAWLKVGLLAGIAVVLALLIWWTSA